MHLDQKGIYILVDPFNRADSGVTAYTKLASLKIQSTGISTKIISKLPDETLEDFCLRLKLEIAKLKYLVCVEAPESLASTRLLPASTPLHIRLHCSRSLGAVVQGLPYSAEDVRLEQRELKRAMYISSPSWASYFASSALFKFKRIPVFYPNPAPTSEGSITSLEQFDVAFIGRFQKLKGTEYLTHLAERLPNLRFAVFCPPTKSQPKLPDNIKIIDGTALSKSEIYSTSKLVIVPSIFETSSMVVIEALTYGCNVVAWEHLGAVEHFRSYKELTFIPPGNIDAFELAINHLYKTPRSERNVDIAKIVNSQFQTGLNNLLKKSKSPDTIPRPPKNIETYLNSLVKSQIKLIMKKKQSPLLKKTKKLIFHPVAFFRDSKEAKYIRKRLQDNRLKKLLNLKEEFKNHPALQVKRETVLVQSAPVKALLDISEPREQIAILENYMTTIENDGRIEFKVRPAKPKGYATAFLHPKSIDQEFLLTLFEKLNEFEDFKYVSTERMQLGCFDIDETKTPLSVINRIDAKNKGNLSEISFIILLNAPANLCYALRYSGTDQKIILIKTDETLAVEPESLDTLITVHEEIHAKDIRRIISLDSQDDIPTAIRRALQEVFPRKKDMLLPIAIDDTCEFDKNDFANFDARYFQGILKLKETNHSQSTSMTDIYENVSKSVVGIAVMESIYMRYRSQCEAIERGESPLNLIKTCLKDGIMFDVQEV